MVERKGFTFHYHILQLCQAFFCSQISLLTLLSVGLSISRSLFSDHDTIFLKLVLYISSVFDIALKHINMQSPQMEYGDKTKPTTKDLQRTTFPIMTWTKQTILIFKQTNFLKITMDYEDQMDFVLSICSQKVTIKIIWLKPTSITAKRS